MLKDITIGQFFPGNSAVHRTDPRQDCTRHCDDCQPVPRGRTGFYTLIARISWDDHLHFQSASENGIARTQTDFIYCGVYGGTQSVLYTR